MLYTIIIQGYPSFTQTIQSNGYSSFTNSQVCPLIKSINFSATSSTRPLSQLYLTSLPKHFLRTFMATVSLTSTDLSCPLSSKKTSLCPALFRSPSAKALMWRIFPLSSSTWNTTEKKARKIKEGTVCRRKRWRLYCIRRLKLTHWYSVHKSSCSNKRLQSLLEERKLT